MSDQFDLFADLPAPSAKAVPEPTETPEESAKQLAQLHDAFADVLAGRSMFDMDKDRKARHGLSAEPSPAECTSVHTCGECSNIKPTKFRKHEGVGFFCTESYDDARREDPACENRFQLRLGPCENCGPVCDVYPCPNADPKGPREIEAASAAKE